MVTDQRQGRRPWLVGVTGASGTPYAAALLRGLLAAGRPVDLVVSRAARLTLRDEAGLTWRDDLPSLRRWLETPLDDTLPSLPAEPWDVRIWKVTDLAAPPSSGSYLTHGMVVIPASTASIAAIATGLSRDLLQRAADVTLKERRLLIVVPRETPLTGITLRQLATLADLGVAVVPAAPAFYSKPKSVQQLVDFIAGKVLDLLGVEHELFARWTGQLGG